MRIEAQTLTVDVRAFLKLTGMAESTFGRYGMQDPGFVQRIEKSEKVDFATAVKAREFMVRVLEDARNHESKAFRSAMNKWIETNPIPKSKPAPAPKPKVEEEEVVPPRSDEEQIQLLSQLADQSPVAAQAIRSKVETPTPKAPAEPCSTPAPESPPVMSVQNKRIAAAKERTVIEAAKQPVGTSIGAQLQEIALADDVRDAVNVLKRKWPHLWRQICELAHQRNERPIPVMISMLEAQMRSAVQ